MRKTYVKYSSTQEYMNKILKYFYEVRSGEVSE
jgi:hypothetical protein